MWFFNEYTKQILRMYRTFVELIDTIPIGFTGVNGEKPPTAKTNQVSQDVLYFGATVDFFAPAVLIRIQSISPNYNWMANMDPTPQDTPILAVAGYNSLVMPIIPLVMPFFLKAQGQMQMQFTNVPAGQGTAVTGGMITWRCLRLTNPINGGWDYALGYNATQYPPGASMQTGSMQASQYGQNN